MAKIKAIIFGVSGVLIFEDAIKSRKEISVKFGLDSQMFKEYAIKNLIHSYKGELDYNEFFKELVKEQGLKIDSKIIAKSWVKSRNKYSKMNNKLLREIKSLKKDYFCGILTNSTILNDKAIDRKKVYRLFPFKIISYEQKKDKSDKALYEILVNRLKKKQINPEEILFIDYKEEYLKEAQKFGIQTILFINNINLINKLKELLWQK